MLTVLCLLARFDKAHADLPVYDLDSLAFMSSDIVGGWLQSPPDSLGLSLLHVDRVYKGRLKQGETIGVAYLNYYDCSASSEMTAKSRDVAERKWKGNEHVVLFLEAPAPPVHEYEVGLAAPVFVPIPSGVRLVHDGRVYGFHREPELLRMWKPPVETAEPYRLDDGRGRPILSSAEFDGKLDRGLAFAKELSANFDNIYTQSLVPWLMNLIRSRAQTVDTGDTDTIAIIACLHLANSHDIAATNAALHIPLPAYQTALLAKGFACREGREFVLTQLIAPEVPRSDKVFYADLLGQLGPFRNQFFVAVVDPGWRFHWQDQWEIMLRPGGDSWSNYSIDNEKFLERIARLAIAAKDDPDLCLPLINSIGALCLQAINSKPDDYASDDVEKARNLLQQLHDSSKNSRICEAAQRSLWESSVHIGLTDFAATLVPLTPAPIALDKVGNRLVVFHYYVQLSSPTDWMAPDIVVANKQDGKEVKFPAVGGRSFLAVYSTGVDSVTIPPDWPAGTYRIFYRFHHGIGRTAETMESSSFEIAL